MLGRVLACLALAAGFAAGVPAAPAQALPVCDVNFDCLRTYYSRAELDERVGYTWINCAGQVQNVGTATRWSTFRQVPCSLAGPA